MTQSESIAKIAMALAKAQGTIENAEKDSRNPHYSSRYSSLTAVMDACRAALASNEIAFIQSPSTDGVLVRLTTKLAHSSGEWIESDVLQVQAKDPGPQAVGSCITYLKRFQLTSMVGVAPDTDDDGEAAEGRGNGKTQKPVLVPQMPPGYSDWLTGFTTAAESGLESMRAFWRESPQTMRDFLMQTAPKTVDTLKERATFVDTTKTPVSPELAHEEAVAKMRPKASRA